MRPETHVVLPDSVGYCASELEFLRQQRHRAIRRLREAVAGTPAGVVHLLNPAPWFRRYPVLTLAVLGAIGVRIGMVLWTRERVWRDAKHNRADHQHSDGWIGWIAEVGATFLGSLRRAIFGALTARLIVALSRESPPTAITGREPDEGTSL